MSDSARITVTLRGKNYVISTSESAEHVHTAARLLDQTLQVLTQQAGPMRDDQLVLFAALQSLVSVIKERDLLDSDIAQSVDRLTAALEEVAT